MENKLIIFLVFASLAQSAYVPKLKADYGLAKKDVGVLQKIIVNQELSVSAFLAACSTFYDIIFDLEGDTDDINCKLGKSLGRLKAGMDICLDSDVLALGKSCSAAVEVARDATHADFDDAFARLATSLSLAEFENYSKMRAAIEIQHAASYKDYANLAEVEYGVINTCLNTTDADTQAIIENGRIGLFVSATHVINIAFNAIKVYAAAVPTSCRDVTFTLDLKNFRDKAFANIKTYVVYKFSLLRTLYINSYLNQCGIVSGVAQSQYAEVVSIFEYREGHEGIFSVATSYLKRIDLGLYDDDDRNAFSATNATFAKVTAVDGVGDGVILDFISFVHPDSSSRIATAREYLHAMTVKENAGISNAFDVAVARDKTHSETIDSIEALKKTAVSMASEYTQYIFGLIRDNRTFDEKTEVKLKSLQDVALHGATARILVVLDAAVILANASYTDSVTEKDYCAIKVLQDKADETLGGFTQGITAACLLVFRVMTAS